MSILIKGADISPDHIQGITVFPEGFAIVNEYEMRLPIKTTKCEVAPVPTPHGRLIDADAAIYDIRCEILEHQMNGLKGTPRDLDDLRAMWQRLEDEDIIPTVMEAEE